MNINDQSEWFYQFISALSIIYGNTITQPTSQSPLSHCEHLVHSITHLIIHTFHNSLLCPLIHKTIILLPFIHSITAFSTHSTHCHPHSFLHSLTHSTNIVVSSAVLLCIICFTAFWFYFFIVLSIIRPEVK